MTISPIDIVNNLGLPDVIAVQEMQDNDGTGRGTRPQAARTHRI